MLESKITLDPVEVRRDVPSIGTWHEWCEKMQGATTLEEKVGLLHFGLDMSLDGAPYGSKYDHLDPLRFYFGLADGWTSTSYLRDQDIMAGDEPVMHYSYARSSRIAHTQSDQRQVLATKAFDVLVASYFKPWLSAREEYLKRRDGTVTHHDWQLVMSGALPLIQRFFCYEPGEFSCMFWNIRNLHHHESEHTPQEKAAVKFLTALPHVLWSWQEEEIESYDEGKKLAEKKERNTAGRSIVEAGKIWIAQILCSLDRLDLLTPWPIEPDDPCVKALEAIALQAKLRSHSHHVLEDRPVTSLEEACMTGSRSAQFVVMLRLVARERQRLQGIWEDEQAQREAVRAEEQRQREIQAAAATLAQATARLTELQGTPPIN